MNVREFFLKTVAMNKNDSKFDSIIMNERLKLFDRKKAKSTESDWLVNATVSNLRVFH